MNGDATKVIDKVKKLLARSTTARGATEAEAATSMRLAMEMLARHDMTMDDVATRGDDEPSHVGEGIAHEGRHRRTLAWALRCGQAAAAATFCHYVFRRYGAKELNHVFIGRADHVAAAKELVAYLLDAAESIADAACPRGLRDPWREFKRDFLDGCSIRLHQRATELSERAKSGELGASSNLPALRALALVCQDECEAFIKANMRVRKSTFRTHLSAAFVSGHAAGDTINLRHGQKQVSS